LDRRRFLGRAATGAAFATAGLAAACVAAPGAQASKRIRVGVIGCGSVSGRYLPHLANCPYAELVSTCDIIPERAAKRAKEFSVPNHYPHISPMLAGAKFDLLVNLTDMQEHEHLNREAIAAGKTSASAEQEMIKLGVARLPEIEKDNTDRNRTSPFAFTGNKFEFRAVGSSQSIAFPIVLLNAAVAEAIAEITAALRAELKKTKKVHDAVLKVVRPIFKETSAVRFEGNNYSPEWVTEAAKRGLLNLRRTPEALAQFSR
jgi:hypothetical protein